MSDDAPICLGGGGDAAAAAGGGGFCPAFGMGMGMGRTTIQGSTTDGADGDTTTALIAQEMNRLSAQEREQVYEGLHGVSATIHETPKLIEGGLLEMEKQLQSMPSSKKLAYDLAQFMRHDYVQDPTLQLMFLRADRFDAQKAAKRFIEWFQWKLDLSLVRRNYVKHKFG